jgi:threonine dehydratase
MDTDAMELNSQSIVRWRSDGVAIPPSVEEVRLAADRIAPFIIETPVVQWRGAEILDAFGANTDVWLKLESFQAAGSFKARAALNIALSVTADIRRRGFTAFSSGNHAAAVAYAAKVVGATAKVVMLKSANSARIANCERFGGEIVFAENGASAVVQHIERTEGRYFIHPYEGLMTAAGVGSMALEMDRQVPDLDAVVLAVGGGGLCSGVAATLRQIRPDCEIFAVEPEGADTMFRSFKSGVTEHLSNVNTIADSLAPPHTLPYSLNLCKNNVDQLELISDNSIRDAMRRLYKTFRLAVEPGGAASTAGAFGPLRERLVGKRVCLLVCGSNIDLSSFVSTIDEVGI